MLHVRKDIVPMVRIISGHIDINSLQNNQFCGFVNFDADPDPTKDRVIPTLKKFFFTIKI